MDSGAFVGGACDSGATLGAGAASGARVPRFLVGIGGGPRIPAVEPAVVGRWGIVGGVGSLDPVIGGGAACTFGGGATLDAGDCDRMEDVGLWNSSFTGFGIFLPRVAIL